jgi:hypothetical protein
MTDLLIEPVFRMRSRPAPARAEITWRVPMISAAGGSPETRRSGGAHTRIARTAGDGR